jgi:hypothetical protein
MNTSQHKSHADLHSVDSDANYSARIELLKARDQELEAQLIKFEDPTKQPFQKQAIHLTPPKYSVYSNNHDKYVNSTISLLREWLEEKDNEHKILKARVETLQANLHEKDIELILLRDQLASQEIIEKLDTDTSLHNQGNPPILNHRRSSDLTYSTFSPQYNSVSTSCEGDDQFDETLNNVKFDIKKGLGAFKGKISTIGDQTNNSMKFRKSNHSEDDNSSLADPSVDATEPSSTYHEIRLTVQKYALCDSKGDGGKYTGEILKSTGMPHGAGRMEYDHKGRTYVGDWKYGRWNGAGKSTESDGDSYEGEYRRDQRHGKGKLVRSDGRVYEGEFQGDKEHGRGRTTWTDGAIYEGEYRHGKREGRGKYSFSGGGYYDGYWKDDFYDGFGGAFDWLYLH